MMRKSIAISTLFTLKNNSNIFQTNQMRIKRYMSSLLALATAATVASAAPADGTGEAAAADSTAEDGFGINWSTEAIFTAGSHDFAPYYIMSNNHGILSSSKDALVRVAAKHDSQRKNHFSYSFGVDLIGGYTSSVDYDRYYSTDPGAGAIPVTNGFMKAVSRHPSRFWIQQLYGEVRYRSIFLSVGMKEHSSALLSPTLSSGDFVESGNARPIPEVRVGFSDFTDIPLTNGWVQIQGELSYGKMTDNAWMREHYNYYNGHINQGALYSYKRCYFRTKPAMPFSATVGMQVGAFFGGETTSYINGKEIRRVKFSRGLKQFFKVLIPSDGGLSYYSGSSLGCWDLQFRYRFSNNSALKAYMQKPFEDGSGIGFLNGFDGLWGLQYNTSGFPWIRSVVAEYLDFTNQSGPMHWDPDDVPGTTIGRRAEGNDNYYYNHEYNAYANYGMAIGTPFLRSPIYNTDGVMEFTANRVRGFHIGMEGDISRSLAWRLLGGYRVAYGWGGYLYQHPKDDTSLMLEAAWKPAGVKGLSFRAALAIDHGTLLGNNVGGMLTVRFNDIFRIR